MTRDIVFRCRCGQKLRAPETMRGRQFSCPSCGHDTSVPKPPPKIDRPPVEKQLSTPVIRPELIFETLPAQGQARAIRLINQPYTFVSGFICALLVVFWSYGFETPAGWWIGYVACVLSGILGAMLIRFKCNRIPFSVAAVVGLIVGVGFAIYVSRTATTDHAWTDQEIGYLYADTKNRSGQVVHRTAIDNTGRTMNGNMAGDTKPHGEWTIYDHNSEDMFFKVWYWYGDEITEGEWHLRNQ